MRLHQVKPFPYSKYLLQHAINHSSNISAVSDSATRSCRNLVHIAYKLFRKCEIHTNDSVAGALHFDGRQAHAGPPLFVESILRVPCPRFESLIPVRVLSLSLQSVWRGFCFYTHAGAERCLAREDAPSSSTSGVARSCEFRS